MYFKLKFIKYSLWYNFIVSVRKRSISGILDIFAIQDHELKNFMHNFKTNTQRKPTKMILYHDIVLSYEVKTVFVWTESFDAKFRCLQLFCFVFSPSSETFWTTRKILPVQIFKWMSSDCISDTHLKQRRKGANLCLIYESFAKVLFAIAKITDENLFSYSIQVYVLFLQK